MRVHEPVEGVLFFSPCCLIGCDLTGAQHVHRRPVVLDGLPCDGGACGPRAVDAPCVAAKEGIGTMGTGHVATLFRSRIEFIRAWYCEWRAFHASVGCVVCDQAVGTIGPDEHSGSRPRLRRRRGIYTHM